MEKIQVHPKSNPKLIGSKVFLKGFTWGFLGGLVGTLIMDLILISALMILRQPGTLCFSVVGDTVSRFLDLFGLQVSSGIPTGVVTHYVIGPLFGILFGVGVMRLPLLRNASIKRIILAAFVYVEVFSLPIFALIPILLKMDKSTTMVWFTGSIVMHLIMSFVMGTIVWYGTHLAIPGNEGDHKN